ncbi:hypothetical protein COY30_00570 [Candidatus Woesebacteria bacterium CG_4_10_14_0_2_um_filter_44_9]|uniref:Uncharacterized protein n=1 Tax=Candidatus Woesebacteria bacterium CG_4_10_14_0_2_um_filter_44_9 TaxID=1975055 RepID=A0A2M7TIJ6_9BACT|nr:MAG: hypothetical protein COY30_00570 [Candidatus Woesebacteria bacterium CG_4_10_14_0_2_um_filter_44_9]
MLTRRTNVLFDEADYATLLFMSREKNKTIGELIRSAVAKTYKSKADVDNAGKSLKSSIQRGWRLLVNPKKPLAYKALIEYGRKY